MSEPFVIPSHMTDGSPPKPSQLGLTANDTAALPPQWLASSEGTGTSTTLYDGWPTHSAVLTPLEPRISSDVLFNSYNYREALDRSKRPLSRTPGSRLSGLLPSWPISSSSGGKPVSSSGHAVNWEVCSIDFSSSRPNTHVEPNNTSSVPTDIANATKHPVFRQLMGQSSSSGCSSSSNGGSSSSNSGSALSYATASSSGSALLAGSRPYHVSTASSDPPIIADSDSDRTISDVDDSAYLPSDQLDANLPRDFSGARPPSTPTRAAATASLLAPSLLAPSSAPGVQPVVKPVTKAVFNSAADKPLRRSRFAATNFVPASPESESVGWESSGSDFASAEPGNSCSRKRTRSRKLDQPDSHFDDESSDTNHSEALSSDLDSDSSDFEPGRHSARSLASTTPAASSSKPRRKTSKPDAAHSLQRWRDSSLNQVLRVSTTWTVPTNPAVPLNVPHLSSAGSCPRIVLSTRHQMQCMVKREAMRRQSEILENPDNGHLPDNLGIEPRLNRLQTRDLGRRYLRPLLRPKSAVHKAVMAQNQWPRITRGSIKCSPHCDQTFTTWPALARHLDTTVDFTHRPYLCQEPDCLWSAIGFPTLSECWRHTRAAHTVVKFDCELCELEGENRTFTRSDALRRHYGRVHLQEASDEN